MRPSASAASDKQLPRVTYTNLDQDFSGVHDELDAAIGKVEATLLGKSHAALLGATAHGNGRQFTVTSPIDSDIAIGTFPQCDRAAIDIAVKAAKEARPQWEAFGWRNRVKVLMAAADLVAARKFALSAVAILEVGKSHLEAIGEVEEAVDLIRYYAGEMERNNGYILPHVNRVPGEESYALLRPYGVFAVIAPFNFPVALSIGMMTSALVAGNTVVYKPNEANGLSGRLIVDCFREAGVPAGALSIVFGGAETGAALAEHADVDGIAFTGSNKVGMNLLRLFTSGRAAKPVLAEMGGKNAVFVTEDADLDVAAKGIVHSAFGLQGQKCSALSKAYISRAVYGDLVKRLVSLAEKITIGDPRRRDVYMGPVINKAAAERYLSAAEAARKDGKVLAGGVRLAQPEMARGYFMAPTILAELGPDHWINREELFLPMVSLQQFDRLGDAIADANSDAYGLTAGLYTRNQASLDQFLRTMQAGVLYVNRASGATTGAWPGIQTFCGWKGSGATGKGGLGTWYVPQFMREQSVTRFMPEGDALSTADWA
jgi:1-pyrroline-5-carboxylate dehydrogenase